MNIDKYREQITNRIFQIISWKSKQIHLDMCRYITEIQDI